MDNKNNIVSSQLNTEYPYCIFDIFTCHRNKTILYLLMLMCVIIGVVSLFQKNFAIGIEALILGFLLSPYEIPMVGTAVIAFLQGIN